MRYEAVEIRRLTNGCGAEVLGVDLNAMSNRQWAEVQRAFVEHGVIFFRDQTLTREQHLAFARRWGPIDVNRFFKAVEGHPEIAEVRKEPGQKTNIGNLWHTDHSYDQIPAMGSILVAREVPAEGGDTLFANMYLAFETLSPGLQHTLERMNAVHSAAHVFGAARAADPERATRYGNPEKVGQPVVHPVVIRHPLSGRKALYVNADFTLHFEGWSVEDSRPLLEHLYAHAVRPELTCRFRWENGSVAFWDNRATWHYAANDYHGERRLMHRVTVGGCALQPALQERAAEAEIGAARTAGSRMAAAS